MIENEFTENVLNRLYILCYIHIYFQIRSGSFITNVRVCNTYYSTNIPRYVLYAIVN